MILIFLNSNNKKNIRLDMKTFQVCMNANVKDLRNVCFSFCQFVVHSRCWIYRFFSSDKMCIKLIDFCYEEWLRSKDDCKIHFFIFFLQFFVFAVIEVHLRDAALFHFKIPLEIALIKKPKLEF
jgi:hypothetical protein